MATTAPTVQDVCAGARDAARVLARLDRAAKDAALHAMADALGDRSQEILEANARDMDAGREAEVGSALLDRLSLTEERLAGIASDVRRIAELPDPVGEVIEERTLPNGLALRRTRFPLGVVAVVYEARPNVTIDCSALCLKSGNAIVLRGSSSAAHSNAVLAHVAADAVASVGLPAASVSLVAGGGRDELALLAQQEGYVDLIIPRGGDGLKAALKEHATVPVLYAAAGNCHLYVDAAADLDMALEIAHNAKVQRPGVCNSIETLVVHAAVAEAYLPRVLDRLRSSGVELRGDERVRAVDPGVGVATDVDWATEYHDLILAVKVVDSADEAIGHVNRFTSGHSDGVVTANPEVAHEFQREVDTAAVYVNASTRFTDGAEFGMGAEIGNSTQKLHARGPIALRELCTYKYLVEGTGQVK